MGASQNCRGFKAMVGDTGSAGVNTTRSSILSSAEQRGARIEACPEPVEGGAALQGLTCLSHPSIQPSLRFGLLRMLVCAP